MRRGPRLESSEATLRRSATRTIRLQPCPRTRRRGARSRSRNRSCGVTLPHTPGKPPEALRNRNRRDRRIRSSDPPLEVAEDFLDRFFIRTRRARADAAKTRFAIAVRAEPMDDILATHHTMDGSRELAAATVLVEREERLPRFVVDGHFEVVEEEGEPPRFDLFDGCVASRERFADDVELTLEKDDLAITMRDFLLLFGDCVAIEILLKRDLRGAEARDVIHGEPPTCDRGSGRRRSTRRDACTDARIDRTPGRDGSPSRYRSRLRPCR